MGVLPNPIVDGIDACDRVLAFGLHESRVTDYSVIVKHALIEAATGLDEVEHLLRDGQAPAEDRIAAALAVLEDRRAGHHRLVPPVTEKTPFIVRASTLTAADIGRMIHAPGRLHANGHISDDLSPITAVEHDEDGNATVTRSDSNEFGPRTIPAGQLVQLYYSQKSLPRSERP